MKTKHPELTAQLERLALREITREWREINRCLFGRALRQPLFSFTDSNTTLGRWVHHHRTIEIARKLLYAFDWPMLVEVLKHETAHQFVDECLQVADETAHGQTFRRVCKERCIDLAAAGPSGSQVNDAQPSSHGRILSRITKLLALAQSDNEHEAHAAMQTAQNLMLKHNIELSSASVDARYTFRHLGKPTGRISETLRALSCILNDHFFVEAIWVPFYKPREGKRVKILEINGTPENIEIAAYVYRFLLDTAERLWQAHRSRQGISSNRDRQRYHAGVMLGFCDTLERNRKKSTKQGLIWLGDASLRRFFRTRHPYIQKFGGGYAEVSPAHVEGREAGRKIVLNKPVASGPSDRIRLLPKPAQ